MFVSWRICVYKCVYVHVFLMTYICVCIMCVSACQSASEFDDLVELTAEEAGMLELAATRRDPAHQPPPKRRRPSASCSFDDEEAMIMAEYASECMDIPPEEDLQAPPKTEAACEKRGTQPDDACSGDFLSFVVG